ncbi:MAG: glutamine synthetase, catalytic domain protein [Candidatus Xenolissoclinum pacificiensis L6]|uniref:Glutamine synthetase, catalytic domain protein n=1 Tax=Candidatus Xenolissoclinum pacificiensis L6 TaxID=1401685 RepID=W2V2V1_9RICK|nr:MAG: glutamine synthetase, catalytic domain protein [Candidatus Xenolissoclinum pacificiensis L6]
MDAYTKAEVEFYCDNPNTIARECLKVDSFFAMIPEDGKNQFEIITRYADIENTISTLQKLKEIILKNGGILRAMPFVDQPPSSFQVTFFLKNNDSVNMFNTKKFLMNAIGGLCRSVSSDILHFAPSVNSYYRIVRGGMHVPKHISWSNSSCRSAMIRIKKTPVIALEHRLSGCDVVFSNVINKIIDAAIQGIKNEYNPPNQCFFPNSFFSEKYTRLPLSLTEALKLVARKKHSY